MLEVMESCRFQCYLSNFNWYDVVQYHSNAENMWKAFVAVLYHVIDLFVPSVVHRNKQNDTERKRYSRDIIEEHWRESAMRSGNIKPTAKT